MYWNEKTIEKIPNSHPTNAQAHTYTYIRGMKMNWKA